ncbi:MAG: Mg2+-importing ATPase [Candidatus Magasanikbacteria bacterium GW2011_GWC2_40_17]|uniref:Magnesium-transporting ATPase, P-type 1 n=1 Tax=Candidatus Magasanikbacteria bacterium GW2011_GWA2_42_32 TaxID=1619039 RepID=A0A0G1A8C7_9BACT|nr:MAG: Mg2+-importing ATPase [Candidatus Magasanikbacteria bacterium GW2011_GWC2_40_17]KKS57312.1 MAG: Mg2+-importing ATPase [Candidatus Magasanikbacteria bacterium GW2011_GWA2_42_32]OGH85796.1 MAG: magnesium-translocating P-type ATPase [Candidatus Magasanikbacteria bacterium RIFOXYB2_FULL_38_10]
MENILGLSGIEASFRLKKFGENIVKQKKKINFFLLFLKKFNSPLLILLIFVSLVSFFLGESVNAIIILVMVFVSAVLDFFNTFKSEKAVDKLINRVVTTATVWRDGQKKEVVLKKIVPGDIIELTAGDIIPGDGRLLEAKDFFVNQAALTGESFPVEKKSEKGEESMILMGTSVIAGRAIMEVEKTGRFTKYGEIAERLEAGSLETEFAKGLRRFSYFILRITFVLVFIVFTANYFLGRGFFDSFLFALAIAIGLTPELLPMIVSVALSHGSLKMAKKDVIVKNLLAIENFGGMNVLCTDKTGTLTKDKITLIKNIDILGEEKDDVFLYAYLSSMFHTGVINPLDKAIKEYKKLDIDDFKKIDEIPFDFMRRRNSVVVEKDGRRWLISKGAPENMWELCQGVWEKPNLSTINLIEKGQETYQKLSADGFRVLAVAIKEITDFNDVYEKDVEDDLIFVGFAAFLDPPKETVKEAIGSLEKLGVEIKILTGDSAILTQKICRDINLVIKGTLTGEQMEKMTEEELLPVVGRTTIFARVNPIQKEKIILLLKKNNVTVGYLGDGINDAPALKAADVGISVNNAVDVAKETADIILLKKSLDVLKDGIIEGRKTFQNTLKYIMMGLSSNFGNMFSMTFVSFLLPFLPMLPAQILLNNFLYDMSQLSLATDTVDEEAVKKPLRWNLPFIRKYMLIFGPISSLFDFITFGVLFWFFHFGEKQFQTGWFIESLATQVFVIYVIRTQKIPFLRSRPSFLLFFNTLLIVIIAWALPYLPLGSYFSFTPLPLFALISIVIIVIAYLILTEFLKCLFFNKSLRHKQLDN